MIVDKALANLEVLWTLRGGDTGRRRAEHRSFLLLVVCPQQKGRNGSSVA